MGAEYLENLKKLQGIVVDDSSRVSYTFDEYAEETGKTAVYPSKVPDDLAGVVYCALGLVGEAGEVAGKVKKLLRDCDTPEKRLAIVDEIGDTMWYIPRLLEELGKFKMSETAKQNVEKVHGRLKRGTIHGNGDTR
jgi:NTP pyrophosphatase (non-canonical NTP hydrolase)